MVTCKYGDHANLIFRMPTSLPDLVALVFDLSAFSFGRNHDMPLLESGPPVRFRPTKNTEKPGLRAADYGSCNITKSAVCLKFRALCC